MPPIDSAKQRAFAVEVVGRLRAQGFEALWAGGCVRDQLLGHTPKDYDVATSALPEQVRELFGRRQTLAIGAAFGVIAVRGPKPAGQIEVVTFRQDATYSDGRRPDAIQFSTPEEDAARRDFTINGLFYDPIERKVIDFVGGQADLAAGVVRAIGDARARFTEDKLRLLRAVRFAATFDFKLEDATRAALVAMAPEVLVVSPERIAAEVERMLVQPRRAAAMQLLLEVGLLAVVLPELAVVGQSEQVTLRGVATGDAWRMTLDVLDRLEQPGYPLALAALVRSFVDDAGSRELCRRLKMSNRDTDRVAWLVQNHDALVGARRQPWPKLQRLLIAPGIDELLALHEATACACRSDAEDVAYCRGRLQLPPDKLNPPPLLTGDDLIVHGVPRGKHYQALLEAVRDAQLENRIHTKDQALDLIDEIRKRDHEE